MRVSDELELMNYGFGSCECKILIKFYSEQLLHI